MKRALLLLGRTFFHCGHSAALSRRHSSLAHDYGRIDVDPRRSPVNLD
jgi:hypothetical protein